MTARAIVTWAEIEASNAHVASLVCASIETVPYLLGTPTIYAAINGTPSIGPAIQGTPSDSNGVGGEITFRDCA